MLEQRDKEGLLAMLDELRIFVDKEDECLWIGDSLESYTVKAGARLALPSGNETDPSWLLAWKGLAPPRV